MLITLSRIRQLVLLGCLSTVVASCELDLKNPNAPTSEEIVGSEDGIIAVTVGMQAEFAGAIEDYLVPSSLGTDEWGTRTRALLAWISMYNGDNFEESFSTVYTPYASSFQTIRSANTALAGASALDMGTGTGAGVNATAKLFKAMTLGWLIQIYERVPLDVAEGAVPVDRAQVMASILSLLESARTDLGAVTDADLASFSSRALAPGFDLRNTVDAMLARFYLMDGQYANAIAAADRVDLTVLSLLEYPVPTRNPIENLAFQLEYVGGLQSFADEAEAGDQRPGYWLDLAADPLPSNPSGIVIKPLKKYSSPNEPFPIYLPDEMRLIKAEALARTGQFGPAAALVNAVRTQAASAVDEPVAGLPAMPAAALDSEAELLQQIAYERRYELYMQGLRWEDTRRFGPALTTTPVFQFLPLPQTECLVNPNAGC